MRKRLLIVLGGLVLAVCVAVGSVVVYEQRRGHDVKGSPAVEFHRHAVPKPPRVLGAIEWPMFGFNPQRLHVAPVTNARPPFRPAWKAGGSSLIEFAPAIAFNRLYFANGAGSVIAISSRTGARAWHYDTKRCVASSPAVDRYQHGTVYESFLNRRPCNSTRAGDGEVVALSAGRGRVRWIAHIGATESSPLVVDNRLYVGDWLGKIYAIDARNGKIIWHYQTGGAIKGAIAWDDGRLFVGSYDGHVYALNAATGTLVWRGSADPRLFRHGTFYSSPAVAYGRVYIGSTDGKVYSFGEASGKRRWSHTTGGYVYASPAVWNDRVYIGSYDHWFYAFDAATGALDWRFQADDRISGSATVVDGVVYFATLKGTTYGLDARTGEQLWSFPDGHYSPVVADGKRLYLVGYAKVYGLEPR
jgi:outer membrane protein assembly factor BamB